MILIETQKEEFSKLKDIRIFGKEDNTESYNGNLLVLGLGGLGSRVVCDLKGMLMDSIKPEDNINFMMIDSDIPAMEATINDSMEGVGLNAMEVVSIYRPNLDNILADGIDKNPVHPNLAKWMKSDFPNIKISTEGAKGNRQIGRLMFSNAYEDMRIMLFERIEEIYEKSGDAGMDVIIVSSVAGGTGSGILADVTYNIKAFARSKKWSSFRVGGCLLMPDILFANKSIYENEELRTLLLANGCATLKEVDYLMRVANRGEGYVFESTTHRLSMKENIFDACILVSGKKDEQGYIPEHIICSDVAYFLRKLATNKYIGIPDEDGNRRLLRDVYFEKDSQGLFKVVNESDYRIPIREIENICEYTMFERAYNKLFEKPEAAPILKDLEDMLSEIREFSEGKPGDDIKLNINGLIKPAQFEKPGYKLIKKGQDDLRTMLPRQLSRLEQEVPIIVKSIKNKLCATLDEYIARYMKKYGPFITMDIIGAAGVGGIETDKGIIAELARLEKLQKEYRPSNEFSRTVESILDIVAKRFFTMPAKKRETEDGYYEYCMKDALAKERALIIDGMDSQDVFGDAIRLLRQRAEHINDVFTPFCDDLKNAVEELTNDGKKVVSYLLTNAERHEFLPSDYITEERINELRDGIIALMVEHENDIDASRPVPVKAEMERVYKNILMGVGVYAPEKLIAVAFAAKKPSLQDTNVMFVSPANEKRDEIMSKAARAFVEAAKVKTQKKKLCTLKEGAEESVVNRKYISLPEAMPYFSKAITNLLVEEYGENPDSITKNVGELELSVDDLFMEVPLSMLECANDMQQAYNSVSTGEYCGLHTDEVTRDMRNYPNIA